MRIEEYRRRCNPQGLNVLDVMAGERGRTQRDARQEEATPSKGLATVIVLSLATVMFVIAVVGLLKVR